MYLTGLTQRDRLFQVANRWFCDKVEPEVAYDKEAPMFVVSSSSEKKVSRGYGITFWVLLILGWILSLGGWSIKDLGYDIPLKEDLQSFLVISLAYIGLLILGWIWMVYNDVIRLRNFWSSVDACLSIFFRKGILTIAPLST